MRFLAIFLLILLSLSSATGQLRTVSVNTMPLSLANRYGRIRIGVELASSRLIYCVDAEFGNEQTQIIFGSDDYDFWGVRPEVKFRLNNSDSFLAVEASFTYAKSYLNRGTFESSEGSRLTFDRATKRRVRVSFVAKIERKFPLGNIGYLNTYLGFGVARRDVRYLEPTNTRIETQEPTEEWGLSSDETPEGIRILPELVAGFKVGFYLFQF